MGLGVTLGAFGNQHHVRASLQNLASQFYGIADALECCSRTSAQSGAVHDDGVALDFAVEIEVRAVTRVEHRIVFEHDDGGFDSVERGAAGRENRPAGGQSALAAGLAGLDSFVGNVPCAAVNDQGGFHRVRRMAKGVRFVQTKAWAAVEAVSVKGMQVGRIVRNGYLVLVRSSGRAGIPDRVSLLDARENDNFRFPGRVSANPMRDLSQAVEGTKIEGLNDEQD